jgi:hypothetical protein
MSFRAFRVGDLVTNKSQGGGQVVQVDKRAIRPISVCFDDGVIRTFTIDGWQYDNYRSENDRLYHDDRKPLITLPKVIKNTKPESLRRVVIPDHCGKCKYRQERAYSQIEGAFYKCIKHNFDDPDADGLMVCDDFEERGTTCQSQQ